MTRRKEILKQADIYTDDASNYAEWSDDGGWSEKNDIKLVEKAFIEGAEYADKTMLDRACEWLKENIDLYSYNAFNTKSDYTEITLTDEFETAFRRAMEGGAE